MDGWSMRRNSKKLSLSLENFLRRWPEWSKDSLAELEEVCANVTVKYCVLRRIADRSDQLEIAQDVLGDAVECLCEKIGLVLDQSARDDSKQDQIGESAKELLAEIDRSANRRTQRFSRRRKRIQMLADVDTFRGEDPGHWEAAKSACEVVLQLLEEALQRVGKKRRGLRSALERGLFAVGQPGPSPTTRQKKAFRDELLAVCNERANKEDPADPDLLLVDGVRRMLLDVGRGSHSFSRFLKSVADYISARAK